MQGIESRLAAGAAALWVGWLAVSALAANTQLSSSFGRTDLVTITLLNNVGQAMFWIGLICLFATFVLLVLRWDRQRQADEMEDDPGVDHYG